MTYLDYCESQSPPKSDWVMPVCFALAMATIVGFATLPLLDRRNDLVVEKSKQQELVSPSRPSVIRECINQPVCET